MPLRINIREARLYLHLVRINADIQSARMWFHGDSKLHRLRIRQVTLARQQAHVGLGQREPQGILVIGNRLVLTG